MVASTQNESLVEALSRSWDATWPLSGRHHKVEGEEGGDSRSTILEAGRGNSWGENEREF